MCGEQSVHTIAEFRVTLANGGNFIGSDARAPFETFTDGGFDLVEVAGMDARGFPCLDRREDIEGVSPPVDADDGGGQTERLEFADGGVKAANYLRLAIVEEAVFDDGDAFEIGDWIGHGGDEGVCRGVDKEACQQGRVFKIAKEDAHGVEGFGKVRCAMPSPSSERGAITGETAERGGHADRAAGVSTNRNNG